MTAVTQIGDARLYRRGRRVRKMDGMNALRNRRFATIVLAPGAALLAWGMLRLLGVDFVLKSGDTVGVLDVATTALMGSVVGWLVLRAIERRSAFPRTTWTFVATTALAVSIVGPAWFADGGSAVGLIALHVVTAAVVIAGFAGTLPARRTFILEGQAR